MKIHSTKISETNQTGVYAVELMLSDSPLPMTDDKEPMIHLVCHIQPRSDRSPSLAELQVDALSSAQDELVKQTRAIAGAFRKLS